MADQQKSEDLTPIEAIARYERLVKSEPEKSEHWMDLGTAYYVGHRWGEAIAAFERAVNIQADLAHAHYFLGVLYSATGNKDRALQELDAVLKSSRNPILNAQAKARIPKVTSADQLAAAS